MAIVSAEILGRWSSSSYRVDLNGLAGMVSIDERCRASLGLTLESSCRGGTVHFHR